ncbi:hypothetical protein GF371_02875 [Candidatus Woesearchaeota archaeon]|nr:hypothetical protein [Candidatus Woesearchaeota archaeon]
MEKEVIDGIKKFLKKYNLPEMRKKYTFQAPKKREQMYKLFKGSIGKKKLEELLRWAFYNDRRFLGMFLKNLKKNNEADVKKKTKEALDLALSGRKGNIAKSIQTLTKIKGIGGVSASKILMFARPDKFGMLDQFNGKAIHKLKVKGKAYFKKADPNKLTPKQYSEEFEKYTHVIREMCSLLNKARKCYKQGRKWKPADIDMALFRIGRGH